MAEQDPEKDGGLDSKADNNASHDITILEQKELGRRGSGGRASTHSSTTSCSHDDDNGHNSEGNEQPSLSRTSSAERRLVKVPRLQRRGLMGTLTILAEVEDPTAYSRRTKWFITFIVALAGAAAPMGSAIFFRRSATNSVVLTHLTTLSISCIAPGH